MPNTDRKNRNLLANLMDNISDQIYFKDLESRFIMVNKASALWHKLKSPDEAVGQTDFDIYKEEDARRMLKDEHHILKTGDPILGIEEHEVWQNGEEAWVSTSKMPLRDEDGSIIGTFGVSRDITEHKKAEIRAEYYAEENRCFREETENDLRMAAQLQKTYFPSSYPVFNDGNADSVADFFHQHHSGGIVSGDFCSVRKLSDTQAGLFICDVMGHGMRAALVTSSIRTMVEEISHQKKDPAEFLAHMNQVLLPILRQEDVFMFVSACYMVLDVSTGQLRYATAGHPHPILRDSSHKKATWLKGVAGCPGPALAICEEPEYQTAVCDLAPGDSVFMFTDGLVEELNKNGDEFGEERLLAAANEKMGLPLGNLFSGLLQDVLDFSDQGKFEDDVCMVGFDLHHYMSADLG